MSRNKINKLGYYVTHIEEVKMTQLEGIQEYPKVCFCFDGNIKQVTYKKLISELINYFEKNECHYTYRFKSKELKQFLHNSTYHYFSLPYPPLKTKEKDNQIEIWLWDKKDKIQKSIKFFEDVKNKKEINREALEEIKGIIKTHKIALKEEFAKEKCSFRLFIKFSPTKKLAKKSITNGEFLNVDILNDIFEIIKKFDISGNGFVCPEFAFDSDKFNLVSGISFPFDVVDFLKLEENPYAENLIKKFGIPSITAIGLSFKDSPIGVEQAIVSYTRKRNIYVMKFKLGFSTDDPKKMLTKTYLAGLNLTDIIMEEK